MGMGAVEVSIVLGLVLVLIVLLLFGSRTYDIADETIVQGVSWETADQVLFRELSAVRGLPLVESHAGSYTLAQKCRPAWAYAAAVVLFPFGLIFLLVTHEDRVQVSLSAHPYGCRLRVVGHARRRGIEWIAVSIQRVLPVPDVSVR